MPVAGGAAGAAGELTLPVRVGWGGVEQRLFLQARIGLVRTQVLAGVNYPTGFAQKTDLKWRELVANADVPGYGVISLSQVREGASAGSLRGTCGGKWVEFGLPACRGGCFWRFRMSSLLDGIDTSEKRKAKSSSDAEDAARSQRTKLIAALTVLTLAVGVIIWQFIGLSSAASTNGASQTSKSKQQAAELQKSVEEGLKRGAASGKVPEVVPAPMRGSKELKPR